MRKLIPVKDYDTDFERRRSLARRRDRLAVLTDRSTSEEIQLRNSILPRNFWDKAKINWSAFIVGKKSQR